MPGRFHSLYKKWFWNTYDYLGTLIIINVLCLLCVLPLFTLPASLAGLYHVTGKIADYQIVGIRDFFLGFRIHFARGFRLGGIYAIIFSVLLINIVFYLRLMEQWPWIGAFLSGIMLWILIFVTLTGIVTFPLLTQTNDSIRMVLKKGMYFVLSNLGYVIIIFIGGMLIMVLGLVTGVGLIFVAISAFAMLCSTGFRELHKKYDPSPIGSDHAYIDDLALAGQDTEELRSWRDLFKPWDYR